MKFVDLIRKISLSTPIELYYDDCAYICEGTAEEIRKRFAWDYSFVNQDIDFLSINDNTGALMITLKRYK